MSRPPIEPQTPSPGGSNNDPEFASRYPLRILVADSAYTSRRSLNLMLELLGYQPTPAENGPELLDAAWRRQHDLILLDIDDPAMEAIEHAKQIRDARIKTPIVVVTSYSPSISRQSCGPADVNGYITKPLNVGDVKHALRQAYINVRQARAA